MRIYFALAGVQCLLLYLHPSMESLITKINNYDKAIIDQLVLKYQMVNEQLLQWKYKQYQRMLLFYSDDLLPLDMNQLILKFLIKSAKCVNVEIEDIYWYRIYDILAIFTLALQIAFILYSVFMLFNILQNILRKYCSDFVFFLFLGTMDRISHWIVAQQ